MIIASGAPAGVVALAFAVASKLGEVLGLPLLPALSAGAVAQATFSAIVTPIASATPHAARRADPTRVLICGLLVLADPAPYAHE
jgi:hypothetical protein